MLVALSVLCLILGASLAYAAGRIPVRQAALEGLGGSLIVGGLFLIGSRLPLFQ